MLRGFLGADVVLLFVLELFLFLVGPVNLYIACFCLSLYAGENYRFLISTDFADPESLDFAVLFGLKGPLLRA